MEVMNDKLKYRVEKKFIWCTTKCYICRKYFKWEYMWKFFIKNSAHFWYSEYICQHCTSTAAEARELIDKKRNSIKAPKGDTGESK
jgi:hypothetical protein